MCVFKMVAQRGCGISILGDIKKPYGHAPGQLAVGGSASMAGLEQMTSCGPFQPQPLCNPVKTKHLIY